MGSRCGPRTPSLLWEWNAPIFGRQTGLPYIRCCEPIPTCYTCSPPPYVSCPHQPLHQRSTPPGERHPQHTSQTIEIASPPPRNQAPLPPCIVPRLASPSPRTHPRPHDIVSNAVLLYLASKPTGSTSAIPSAYSTRSKASTFSPMGP